MLWIYRKIIVVENLVKYNHMFRHILFIFSKFISLHKLIILLKSSIESFGFYEKIIFTVDSKSRVGITEK
jgi:hypothetical protein